MNKYKIDKDDRLDIGGTILYRIIALKEAMIKVQTQERQLKKYIVKNKIIDINIVRGVVPQTLPSFVYRSIRLLTHSFRSSDTDFLLTYTYAFAQSKGIDIEAHIALKMRYNKTRGCCNSKKF